MSPLPIETMSGLSPRRRGSPLDLYSQNMLRWQVLAAWSAGEV